MKTNFLATALLLVLFAPTLSLYSWLQVRKFAIRREVSVILESEVPESQLVSLVFSKEEIHTVLRWEHSREFEYRGQMYDIVKEEIKGDSIHYLVRPDYKETALNQALARLSTRETNNKQPWSKGTEQLFHFFKQLYHSPVLFFPEKVEEHREIQAFYFSILPNSNSPKPPAPPPKIL